MWDTPELPFPVQSRDRINTIKKDGRRRAVEQAMQSRFFAGKLDHINLDHVHEPEEWAKVPVLTKDELRQISPEDFQNTFDEVNYVPDQSGSGEVDLKTYQSYEIGEVYCN